MKEREYDNNSQRYSGMTMLSSKVVCGKCGGKFTPRPWHANDKYRTIMWQCRKWWRKPLPCKTHNVADKALHFVVHDVARTLAVRKKYTCRFSSGSQNRGSQEMDGGAEQQGHFWDAFGRGRSGANHQPDYHAAGQDAAVPLHRRQNP